MSIKFWCARCGQSYITTHALPGTQIKCRVCGHLQQIPDPALESPATAGEYALDDPPEPRASDAPRRPPPPTARARKGTWKKLVVATTAEPSRLQGWILVLIALSAADILMTHTLLRTSQTFYEANPVAHWFFHRWNMAGMVAFKFGIISGVVALGEFIERRQPGRGRFVLMVGCAAAALVIWQGLRLYLNHGL